MWDEDEPDTWAPIPRGPCGKAVYRSPHAAKKSMRHMQRCGKGRAYAGRLHPYHCPDCRAWHVGHTAYEGD